MENLKLQPKSWEFKDRAQQHDASPQKEGNTKEAGPVLGRQRVGWGTGLAFGPCPLLSGGCSPRVMECSQFDCQAIQTHPKPSEQPCPNRGSPAHSSGSSFPKSILLMVPRKAGKREAGPCEVSCCWIAEEMSQPSNPHPHWWREIKVSG